MKSSVSIENLISMEAYLNGKLSEDATFDLWVEFLLSDEMFEWFLILQYLREIYR